jgi:hypothetical protein
MTARLVHLLSDYGVSLVAAKVRVRTALRYDSIETNKTLIEKLLMEFAQAKGAQGE